MSDTPEKDPLVPELKEPDRKLFERAVRELQAHSVIANFDDDDGDAAKLYEWAEKHQPLLESYFRLAGLGIRAHMDIPVIQLILEDDGESHPLRQRFNKVESGLLVCLWILYYERAHEVNGFIIPVTVDEIYARLTALFATDKVLPQGHFEDAIKRFARYRLVQVEWLPEDFMRSRIGLLPTLMSTYRFADPEAAKAAITPKPEPAP